MQALFECGICLDFYNVQQKKPMVMPCGHTLCEACAKQLEGGKDNFECPYCKVTHFTKVENLPINYQLLAAAE